MARKGGFSLIEFMLSMAIFMIISGAALTLFRQQQLSQQDLGGRVGLNLGLRNAASQLQMDLANAGSGYFQGINMPSWPVGITMTNRVVAPGNSCYNAGTKTYGANCFDTLNIISAADPTAFPPVHSSDSSGGSGATNCSDTSTGTAYTQAAGGLTLAQTAAKFVQGDQLLFMTNGTNGTQITTAVLRQNAAVSGAAVRLTFNATNADGTNTLANDPLDITACNNNLANCAINIDDSAHGISRKVTNKFCGSDWILKLAPIVYNVDNSNAQDPVLTRTTAGAAAASVMDQVIGFKVGTTIWNGNTGGTSGTESANYFYDASTFADSRGSEAYNFALVRSIRVSLVGRTVPDNRGSYKFRNAFDNGPYQVQGIAVVVNPRNLSMNDQ